MHSYEDRIRAVELYDLYGKKTSAVVRELGWTNPMPVDKFCPHDGACSKASGLTPPR
ncbi:hypothetical protein NUKP82_39000 [Klebsiella variicola]|nr:hypothetical protein NUKP82_39000 [Klebsiella variicola]